MDDSRPRVPALVVPDGQGEVIAAAGVEHLFRLTGGQTGGRFAFEEFRLPPATPGPLPHVHLSHDEYFYVLDGELTLATADGDVVLGAGTSPPPSADPFTATATPTRSVTCAP